MWFDAKKITFTLRLKSLSATCFHVLFYFFPSALSSQQKIHCCRISTMIITCKGKKTISHSALSRIGSTLHPHISGHMKPFYKHMALGFRSTHTHIIKQRISHKEHEQDSSKPQISDCNGHKPSIKIQRS
jgi:hypothetical protein